MKVEVFRAEFNQVILILENIHSRDSENNWPLMTSIAVIRSAQKVQFACFELSRMNQNSPY
jgi:hypothetical protein